MPTISVPKYRPLLIHCLSPTDGCAGHHSRCIHTPWRSAPETASALANVRKAGELVVGTEMQFAPFDFLENGQQAGFNKDLFAEVGKFAEGILIDQGLADQLDFLRIQVRIFRAKTNIFSF